MPFNSEVHLICILQAGPLLRSTLWCDRSREHVALSCLGQDDLMDPMDILGYVWKLWKYNDCGIHDNCQRWYGYVSMTSALSWALSKTFVGIKKDQNGSLKYWQCRGPLILEAQKFGTLRELFLVAFKIHPCPAYFLLCPSTLPPPAPP